MRILVVHEIDFSRKVVFEWQEFPEVLARLGHTVGVLDYDVASGWSDVRDWGLGPKRTEVACRLDPEATLPLFRMIGPGIPGVRRLYAALAAGRVADRVFDEFRPDVVLLYAVPTCGRAVVQAARRRGVPVVFRAIDALYTLVPKPIAAPVYALERLVYPSCERILATSPHLAAYIKRMTGGRIDADLVLSPVDTDRFSSRRSSREEVLAELGIPAHKRVVVFVGTLFKFVGLARLLESWHEVIEREPEAHLLVVGGGEDEARLREMAARMTRSSSVTFTGMMPYDEVPRLVSAAEVGICPFDLLPVTRDINPIKVLQYLSCSVPCLCTPLDGTMQVLPEETSGILYAESGIPFAETLGTLLADRERCERLGAAGREWVIGHHSFAALTDELVGHFASVMDQASPQTASSALPNEQGGLTSDQGSA